MRRAWEKSRLTLSSKSAKKSSLAIESVEVDPDQSNNPEIVQSAVPKAKDFEKWHREVNKCGHILESLLAGQPSIELTDISSLKGPTEEFLKLLKTDLASRTTEVDNILGNLINQHGRRYPLARELAMFACLGNLSISTATEHLNAAKDVDFQRYLRYITLARQINSSIVSTKEFQCARVLMLIICFPEHGFENLRQLVQVLEQDGPMKFIDLTVIQNELSKSGVGPRLQAEIESYLEQLQFMSAFSLISWLENVPKSQGNHEVLNILDDLLPSWQWLKLWRPNIERIHRWESGDFTELQRKKLSHIFKLDGPDVTTHCQESLKMAEPGCYDYVKISPHRSETLEYFLDVLYRAHLMGQGALDLFVYLCIDNTADESSLATVSDAMQMGDDSYCRSLLLWHQALSPQSSLDSEMLSLARALEILNDGIIPEQLHPSIDNIAKRICTVMDAVQKVFCEQIEQGTGEYMGMKIFEFGCAIQSATGIHARLPSSLLSCVQQFPPEDILEALFNQLDDSAHPSNSQDTRFKLYLASAIGGRGEIDVGSMTRAGLQEEIKFWKNLPSAPKRDLAKKIGAIPSIDYSLYISCLVAILKEDDFFMGQMSNTISQDQEACVQFLRYIAHRRKLNQLQDDCWLFLLSTLLKAQGPTYLKRVARSMALDHWIELTDDLNHSISPVLSKLPLSGTELTSGILSWWKTLSPNRDAIEFLLKNQRKGGNLVWLYFPQSQDHITGLLNILSTRGKMAPRHRQIVSYLAFDGSNVAIVSECCRKISQTSSLGLAVCDRFFERKESNKKRKLSDSQLSIVCNAWLRREVLTDGDRTALKSVRELLQFPVKVSSFSKFRPRKEMFYSEYDNLVQNLKKIEKVRQIFQHQKPQRMAALLQRVGIENKGSGRNLDQSIPIELVDAVEAVGDSEYELAFTLMGLNSLQRQARGISSDSRMLLLRLRFKATTEFCIHFTPDDDDQSRHVFWRPTHNRKPDATFCRSKPDLFTYYISRHLYHSLQKEGFSWKTVHSTVLSLISQHPTTCIVCSNSISTRLWKPEPCSNNCSVTLQTAPLEVQLHNLLVDPLSIDLIFTCLYEAAVDPVILLTDCPIEKTQIRATIDSFPPLANLLKADLWAAIHGADGRGRNRERLISWLCLKFRGFMLNAQGRFQIPSMPNTKQFLLLNSHHEREEAFNRQRSSKGASHVVFHGTLASRLFPILTEGLKVMSNTDFMINAAARGPGIYCGENQATSFNFAGSTGQSWKHSTLRNMRVMLGCEVAVAVAPDSSTYHVVPDQDSILVRYVFLLPEGYKPPPRHHVEPAMNNIFANLRSGALA